MFKITFRDALFIFLTVLVVLPLLKPYTNIVLPWNELPVRELKTAKEPLGFWSNDEVFSFENDTQPAFTIHSLTAGIDRTLPIPQRLFFPRTGETAEISRLFHDTPITSHTGYNRCLDEKGNLLLNHPKNFNAKRLTEAAPWLKQSSTVMYIDWERNEISIFGVPFPLTKERKPLMLPLLEPSRCKVFIRTKDNEALCNRNIPYLQCVENTSHLDVLGERDDRFVSSQKHPYIAAFKHVNTKEIILLKSDGETTPALPNPLRKYLKQSIYDPDNDVTYFYGRPPLEKKKQPLIVKAYSSIDATIAQQLTLPKGPFNGRGFMTGIKCAFELIRNCGNTHHLIHKNGAFYLVSMGKLVVNRAQGIYRLEGEKWKRLIKICVNPHLGVQF